MKRKRRTENRVEKGMHTHTRIKDRAEGRKKRPHSYTTRERN